MPLIEKTTSQLLDEKKNNPRLQSRAKAMQLAKLIQYSGNQHEKDSEGIPLKFIDPVLRSLINDPFICTIDNRVYSKESIIELLKENNKGKSPITRKEITIDDFIPFPQFKYEIESFKENSPEENKHLENKQREKRKPIVNAIVNFIREKNPIPLKNYFNQIETTIEIFADPCDTEENTLLHLAMDSNLKIIQFFVDYLFNENIADLLKIRNKSEKTPLSFINDKRTFDYITQKIQLSTTDYQSIFMETAKRSNIEFLQQLYNHPSTTGDIINRTIQEITAAGILTPLTTTFRNHLQCCQTDEPTRNVNLCVIAIKKGHLNIVTFFIDTIGVKPNIQVAEKFLLDYAKESNHPKILEFLEERLGVQYAVYAVQTNSIDDLKKIFEKQKDKNMIFESRDENGNNLLHFSIQKSNLEIIRFLVEHLIENEATQLLYTANKTGKTPLDFIKTKETLDYIQSRNISITENNYQRILIEAVKNNDINFLKRIYPNPIYKISELTRYAILYKAVNANQLPLLKTLSELLELSRHLCNILCVLAAKREYLEIVKFFIEEHKIDPRLQIDGKILAEHASSESVVTYLRKFSVYLDRKEREPFVKAMATAIETRTIDNLSQYLTYLENLSIKEKIFADPIDEAENTLLHLMMQTNDLKTIQLFVDYLSQKDSIGTLLRIPNKSGKIPLDFIKTREIFSYMSTKIDFRENNYRSLLIEASKSGLVDFIRTLRTSYSFSPEDFTRAIHAAIEANQLDVLTVSLNFIKTLNLEALLELANQNNHTEIARFFKEQIKFREERKCHVEAVKKAIAAGDKSALKKHPQILANMTSLHEPLDDEKNTLLHFIKNKETFDYIHEKFVISDADCQAIFIEAVKNGDKKFAEELARHRTINLVTGAEACQIATQKGFLSLLQLDVLQNSLTNYGLSVLVNLASLAITNNRLEILKYLVEHLNFDPQATTDGYGFISHAIQEGKKEIVEFLIKIARPHWETHNGVSICMNEFCNIAAKKGRLELVYYFLNQGGNQRVFHHAYLTYVKENDDPNVSQSIINELLFRAVEASNLQWIKCLVEKFGADVNAKNAQGYSLISFAAHSYHLEIYNYLINKGADPTKNLEKYYFFSDHKKYPLATLQSEQEKLDRLNESIDERLKIYNAIWNSEKDISNALIKLFSRYSWTENKMWNTYFSRRHFHQEARELVQVIQHMDAIRNTSPLVKGNYNDMLLSWLQKRQQAIDAKYNTQKTMYSGEMMAMLGYAITKLQALQKTKKHNIEMQKANLPQRRLS